MGTSGSGWGVSAEQSNRRNVVSSRYARIWYAGMIDRIARGIKSDDANFGGRMKRLRFPAAPFLLCLWWLAGCGGGGGTTVNPITIEIQPSTAQSVDVGGTINYTAFLANDTNNQGVQWSLPTSGTACSGNGCGTLTNAVSQPPSVTYVAPTGISAALSVTLTATSVAQTKVTATANINVVLAPAFSTTTLADGKNGVPYSQTISITGGVAPYTYSLATGSGPLPGCLSLNPGPTSSLSTSIVGTPCGSGTSTFTVQVKDSGGAPAVQRTFTITIAPAPALSITTTALPLGYTNLNYSAFLGAQGGVAPLTWSLVSGTLPPGLLLSPTGQVSGIPTATGLFSFLVQVRDSSLPAPGQQIPGTISLTIQAPPALSITTTSLPSGTVATAYAGGSLQASGGIPPYTWSVSQGLLPSGLTLFSLANNTGSISGVPVLATTSSFTVQVTDSEIVPATATQPLSIAIGPGSANGNTLFQGTYSFLFNGFDSGGSVAIIGFLTADGNGKITSGLEDSNRSAGVVNLIGLSGTYSIGTDGRGTLELIAKSPLGATITTDYQLVLDASGNARFFENNSTGTNTDAPLGTHGAGILKPVVVGSSGFSASSFSGNYSFVFSGQDSAAKPVALGGVLHANGAGTLTQGIGDFNDGGTFTPHVNLSGNFNFDTGTRAIAALTFAAPAQINLNFAVYFVSPSHLFFAEMDTVDATHPRLSGEMILQQPDVAFNSTVLQGGSVATGTGVSSSNASVFAGLLTAPQCDGATAVSLDFDENNGGAISAPAPTLTGKCTVTPNGRVSFTDLGASASQTRLAAVYLTGPGQGFLLGSDTAVTTGLLEQQSGGPFTLASVLGGYTLSAPFVAEAQVANVLGQVVANGAASVTGTVDEFDAPTVAQPEGTANLAQSLVATINTLAASGRGQLTTNLLTGFPTNVVFYVVAPGSMRLISVDAGGQHPEVIFLDH